ncbi:MAG: FCSD flavin-binding domain-containing protein [Sterolibacterium sp.]|jgi:sulfide dehydrogenase [flavocytochrome c] flavoprotein subunit
MNMNRRSFIKMVGAATGAGVLGFPYISSAADIMPKTGRRVVVVGGGSGGAIAAKYIRIADPTVEVVLIEAEKSYIACPLSNLVLAGIRTLEENTITLDKMAANHGIKLVYDTVTAVDAGAKKVICSAGAIAYDKLVLSPGIDYRFEEIDGYDPMTTPEVIPHAWKAGPQTLLLKKQLMAMRDGGVVVMTIPQAPYRCPPGPYERISLIAMYLKQHKPKSKIIVWDGNENIVAKAALFRKGWSKHYGYDDKDTSKGLISYNANSKLTKLDVRGMAVDNGIELLKGDVINVIPPQRAGVIAQKAGVVGADKKWCTVNQVTFESTQVKDIHVIGDSCMGGALPKSTYAANSEAKVCALNIVQALNGKELIAPSHVNVCYSYITDKEAVSVSGVYVEKDGKTIAVPNAGGLSPDLNEIEAAYARSWMTNIMTEMST